MAETQNWSLPTAVLSVLPRSPPLKGPPRALETEPVPLPPVPWWPQACCFPTAGRGPSAFLAGAPPWSRGGSVLCSGTVFSSPAHGTAACESGLGSPDCFTRRVPTSQGATVSSESPRGCNTHRCPQFPELMSQFSFSISTRFLKA